LINSDKIIKSPSKKIFNEEKYLSKEMPYLTLIVSTKKDIVIP